MTRERMREWTCGRGPPILIGVGVAVSVIAGLSSLWLPPEIGHGRYIVTLYPPEGPRVIRADYASSTGKGEATVHLLSGAKIQISGTFTIEEIRP